MCEDRGCECLSGAERCLVTTAHWGHAVPSPAQVGSDALCFALKSPNSACTHPESTPSLAQYRLLTTGSLGLSPVEQLGPSQGWEVLLLTHNFLQMQAHRYRRALEVEQ